MKEIYKGTINQTNTTKGYWCSTTVIFTGDIPKGLGIAIKEELKDLKFTHYSKGGYEQYILNQADGDPEAFVEAINRAEAKVSSEGA